MLLLIGIFLYLCHHMDYRKYNIDGEDVFIPIPRSYSDCFELIRSDYYRHNGRRDSMFRIWLGSLTRTSIGFSFWFWLAQKHGGPLRPFARMMVRRYKRRWGLFIPISVIIGYGFRINHCQGIVINKKTVIGNNVNMCQLTTIGSETSEAAIIGNGVYIGPGVNIVDDVKIGSGACIGAGAVVTRDISRNTTVAGVPARRIAENTHSEYIRNPWPIPEAKI